MTKGILCIYSLALGCTYLCLMDTKSRFGPFWAVCKCPNYSNYELPLQTLFLVLGQKRDFLTILPSLKVSKLPFSTLRMSFPNASRALSAYKNDPKGLLKCRKARNKVPNTYITPRKRFWEFRKKVEFGRFRQDCLGQPKEKWVQEWLFS